MPVHSLKSFARALFRPRNRYCDHLWTSVSIRPSGEMEPCSCAPNKGPVFPVSGRPFHDLWNNPWYVSTRAFLNGSDADPEHIFECCRSCPVSEMDRYYFHSMRLRRLEPRLIHNSHLPDVSRELLQAKHDNYLQLIRIIKHPCEKIEAFPVTATIDPSNICNLNCPFCMVGKGELKHTKQLMPLSLYKQILEQIGKYLIFVELYRYGEPLLNPDIIEMISLAAKKYRIYCSVSTNFSMPLCDDFLEGLVDSGLFRLVIAGEDVEQERYSQYRRGGNIEVVMDNLKRLAKIRDKKKSPYPQIVWQSLIFRFNENRLNLIKSEVKRNGVNIFRAVPAYIPGHENFDHWIPDSAGARGRKEKRIRYVEILEMKPECISPRETFRISCRVKNIRDDEPWPKEKKNAEENIRIGVKLLDASGDLIGELGRINLKRDIPKGESDILEGEFRAPEHIGEYVIKLDILRENHYWFEYHPEKRSKPSTLEIKIRK